MRLALYGGSFDPPHAGHVCLAKAAVSALKADKLLIIPNFLQPHKEPTENGPAPEERLELCRLAFEGIDGAQVSDIEVRRGGKSYTADTVEALRAQYPGAELVLVLGADAAESLPRWHRYEEVLKFLPVAVAARAGEAVPEGMTALACDAPDVSSRELCKLLEAGGGAELMDSRVYARIIQNRWYGAKPSLVWLREQAYAMLKPKRVSHVQGCEQLAVKLARLHGADEYDAAVSAILHDITKKLSHDEQLLLCEKYGIILHSEELASPQIIHQMTGAAAARELFGVPEHIERAIRYHTTGRPDMTKLEKILYLADCLEPTRSFAGIDAMRRAAEEDLDAAMALVLTDMLKYIEKSGFRLYSGTVEALNWYKRQGEK